MATLLVGYDLNKPGKDYGPLIDKIKSLGAWRHHLDSTWLVKTTRSTVEIRDALVPLTDEKDELFVVDVTGGPAAWHGFNASGSKWLKDNL